MKKTLLLFLLVIQYYNVFAQKTIDSSYVNYFENTREIPFLHLNKTSFLRGEEIWYKAYVQEQNTQKLHPTTTNLYVSIFNKNGALKDQQLVHITDGTGRGNILVDSTFTGDSYYLKASTKWMKNFEDDNAFYQKIKIVSSDKNNKRTILRETDFYEFKLFPEGGHLVSNTLNNIGILVKNDKNQGVKIAKGIIKDQNDNTVRHFSTNLFGMNSVKLFLKENESYSFHVILENGTELKANLPKPESRGISLIVNSKDSKKVSINVITNNETLKTIAGKQYRVMIHNTRSFKNYPFKLHENHLNHALLLNKDNFQPGINIVTVFNEEDKPISERLFFVKSEELFQEVNISDTRNRTKDSLDVKLKNFANEAARVSASFLPENSKAYKPKNNIISSFLLKPYIKGDIQSPSKLLGKSYKGQQRDLDLLLLIQGWSKYNWNLIFNSPPKTLFDFENGIDITARINKSLSSKQSILLSSKANNLVRVIAHNETPYKLENSFVKKNSTLNFGLNSRDNYYKISPALSFTGGKLYEDIDDSEIESERRTELEVSNFKQLKSEFEDLDEVEVKAKKKKKEDYKFYGRATMFRRGNLDKRIIASGETVIDFLRSKNYGIGYNAIGAPVIIPRGFGKIGSNRGRSAVRMFLDNDEITFSTWIAEMTYLDTVKEIFYGRHPGGFGEEIHIFSLSPLEYINKTSRFAHVKAPIGFVAEKEYYNPLYPSFTDDTYQKFGSVFWEPNIHLEGKESETITIPTNAQKAMQVYIEGITESGKLISKKITLDIK
ncbi:hypothetical protein ACOSP6_16535 [Tenacibaculum sp. MEBiC06402]|uniref:hypothetical protein n=1 Tax=unclassified Tenacibaculum TaxID=2635139 RepID=UPI003B9C6751